MVFEEITEKMIEEICEDMKFFDDNGHFPWEKKRIDITLSGKIIQEIKKKALVNHSNVSNIIENMIVNST